MAQGDGLAVGSRFVQRSQIDGSLGTATTAASRWFAFSVHTVTGVGAITAGTVTTQATSVRQTFASAAVTAGTVTVTTSPTVDTVLGVAAVAAGGTTLAAMSVRATFATSLSAAGTLTLSAVGIGTTPLTVSASVLMGNLSVIALVPSIGGHSGGGSRWPLYGTYRLPTIQPKTKPVSSTIYGKSKVKVGATRVTTRGVRIVAGTADARADAPILAVRGVRVAFAFGIIRSLGPVVMASATRITGGVVSVRFAPVPLIAGGTRTAMGLSEIVARTVLVASAGEMAGHTWTREERNRHAILYSIEPALAARAYRT